MHSSALLRTTHTATRSILTVPCRKPQRAAPQPMNCMEYPRQGELELVQVLFHEALKRLAACSRARRRAFVYALELMAELTKA